MYINFEHSKQSPTQTITNSNHYQLKPSMRHPYPALYSKNKSLQHLLLITITIDLSENTSIIFGSIADQLLNSPSNGFSDMGEDTNHALDSPGNGADGVDAASAAPADPSGDNNKDEMEKKVQVVMRL
eukprot:352879_1